MTVWLLMTCLAFQDHPATAFHSGRQEARRLYGAGDKQGFLESTERLRQAQPGHVPTLYNLALARALNGKDAEALAALAQAAELGLILELPDAPELQALRQSPGYKAHLERVRSLSALHGHGSVAFRLEDPRFFPEGLAHDSKTGAWFLGSVHQRKIVRRDAEGKLTEFVAEGRDGLCSVLGLLCDSERRRLWATSNGIPQTRKVTESELDTAALYCFDLDSGALLNKVALPGKHNLGDLAQAANGDLYASDASGSGIYRLPLDGNALELFASSPWLASAQGLAFSADGALLYVADYTFGPLVIDSASREVRQLPCDVPLAITGLDGLARHGQSLIAVQNGTRPHRIVRYRLADDGRRISAVETLLANSPEFDEPTLGLVVGDAYYLVANGQWGRYDRRFQPLPDAQLKPPCVLRLGL